MTHCVSSLLDSMNRVFTVGMPTPTRMIAGMMVSAISERRLAVALLRNWLTAIAELDHAEEHHARDDDEHCAGDVERSALEVVDVACVVTLGLERVLRGVFGTAAEDRSAATAAPGRASRRARDRMPEPILELLFIESPTDRSRGPR